MTPKKKKAPRKKQIVFESEKKISNTSKIQYYEKLWILQLNTDQMNENKGVETKTRKLRGTKIESFIKKKKRKKICVWLKK